MSGKGKILPQVRGFLPLIVGLGIWQLEGAVNAAEFPPPMIWWSAVAMLAHDGVLMPALDATLTAVLLSLAAASVVGFALGLLIGTLPSFRQWTNFVLEYLRALPPPVIIPIAVLMLGYTGSMKLLVIGFAVLWPIMLNTVSGVSQIPRLTFDVARAFRLSWFGTMVKIVMPATLPSLLLGIRVALPQAVIATLVVEMFTGEIGVGSLMITAQRNYNASGVFGLLAVMGLVGFFLTTAFALLERMILRRWPTAA